MSGSQALETLALATDVVFDKTGTLTEGKLAVQHIMLFHSLNQDDAIYLAQVLEQQSEHPIARAIAQLSTASTLHVQSEQRINRVGHGVRAQLTLHGQSQQWSIGRPEFVQETAGALPTELQHIQHHGTVIALGNQQGFVAAFLLQDQTKAQIPTMLAQLTQQGLHLHILSGDRQAAVQALAQTLNIPHIHAEATPEDKLAYVETLQRQGKKVLMIGDGINDAPVLAASDVSIAVASGADVARDGADIVLLNDEMTAIPATIQQARKTARIIRQNLIWASAYNLIAVPLAVAGLVNPWIAALGMSSSSLLVLLNALRLRR